MRRALAAVLSLILTLLLIVAGIAAWLLLTTSGARWLAASAIELEPRLALTIEAGALLAGLEVSNLAWRGDGTSITADRAVLEWDAGCLLQPAACIDRLALRGLRVQVEPGEAPEDPAAERGQDISLPLPVRVALLQLTDARIVVPGTDLAIGSLQASGRFESGTLALGWARIGQVRLLAAQNATAAADPASATGAAPKTGPIDLPTVDLPLDIVLQNVVLESADLSVGDRQMFVRQVALSASLRDSKLDIERLQLAVEPLEAELAGTMTLSGDYPLSLRLQTQAPLPDLPAPVNVTAQLDGSIEQLAVTANLASPVSLQAVAKLRPLRDGLPFEASVRWNQLAYPLQGEPAVTLQNGEFRASGNLQGYQGTLRMEVAGEQVPAGNWRGRFAGTLNGLQVQELAGETLDGTIDATAQLRWADGLSWQLALEANEINPGVKWPDYPGQLGGKLQATGGIGEDGLSLTASTPGFGGKLRDYPVRLQGTLRKDGNEAWRFDRVRLASGDNRIEVDGALTDQWALQGSFRVPSPEALLPDLAGSASGRFAVRGSITGPDLSLDLTAGNLRYQDFALANLSLDADVRRLAFEQSTLRWRATGVRIGEQRLSRVGGRLEGKRSDHTLSLDVDSQDYGGELRLAGALDSQLNWAGRLLAAALQLPPEQRWTLAEPVALRWDQPRRQLAVEAHCWQQKSARLCLREPASVGERGNVQLALSNFRVDWLSPLLPEGVDWRAPVSGEAALRWRPDAPLAANIGLVSEGGEFVLAQDDDADPVRLAYQRIATTVTLEQEAITAEVSLESRQLGSGRIAVQTQFGPAPRPLDGSVVLSDFQLSLLRAFLPNMQTLEGTVNVRGALAGTLQSPRFVGDVRLADGQLAAPNLPMELADVSLQADVQGSRADLSGRFRSGEGTGELSGTADWSGESWRLDLAVRGEQLRIVYEPVARLQVSPDLNIRVRPQRVDVQGKVLVPSGKITLRTLPEGAVQVSDDVVVINRQDQTEQERPADSWSVTTDVELILGKKVEITGYGLTGRLAGNLRVRQRPGGVPEASGELRIEEGQYKAYGQELEIRQGQLLFAGPISEPTLNVEAVRRVDDVVAGLRVEGEPDAPEATLFSEPSMPQEEILSYLIRGRPLGGGNGGQEQLLAQAAVSLGVFGGKGLAGSLAEDLGVEDFELGTAGEGEDTQVELSGYIAPDLLVRYGIGVFQPVNTLTLRYRINDNFFIEAVSGLENALDFFYEFEF